MKMLLIITSIMFAQVWAQSGANPTNKADKQGSSPVDKAGKAANSQLKGSGVPYTKEKQPFRKTMSTPKKVRFLPLQ